MIGFYGFSFDQAEAVNESSRISANSGRSVLIYSPGRVMVRNSMKSLEVGNEHVFDAYFTQSGKATAFVSAQDTRTACTNNVSVL